MKRIIAIVMCVLMLLFSASCGKQDKMPELESTLSQPTQMPTAASTEGQTVANTSVPTAVPTVQPTTVPTALPAPTEGPTAAPTVKPTSVPTIAPTAAPTVKPTAVPTVAPTQKPTTAPTVLPTVKPTVEPTAPETTKPTRPQPTITVRPQPTITPITKPTVAPTTAPTEPDAYYIYSDNYGNSVQLPEGVDVFDYTLSQAKLPQTVSKYPAIEQKIFQLTNAERAKQGLAPLALEEKAYFFAATRAYEASEQWSHTRPNGEPYYHILAEYKVIGSSGENLYYIQGVDDDYVSSSANVDFLAENAITGWMNSSGHRENILNEAWGSMAVGVYYDAEANKLFSVQLFFG